MPAAWCWVGTPGASPISSRRRTGLAAIRRSASRSGADARATDDDRRPGRQHQGRVRQDDRSDPSGGGVGQRGHRTALADADRQCSSLEWVRLRPGTAAPITALDWSRSLTAPPKGLDRLVIDARRRDEEERCIRAGRDGRCDRRAGAAIGVRSGLDDGVPGAAERAEGGAQEPQARRGCCATGCARAPAPAARLAQFLAEIEHADLGALPDRAIYNDVAAEGLSIFDLRGGHALPPCNRTGRPCSATSRWTATSAIAQRSRKAEETQGRAPAWLDVSRRYDVDPEPFAYPQRGMDTAFLVLLLLSSLTGVLLCSAPPAHRLLLAVRLKTTPG